jgi:hypothetical protein
MSTGYSKLYTVHPKQIELRYRFPLSIGKPAR